MRLMDEAPLTCVHAATVPIAITVKVVVSEIPSEVALIVVDPASRPVAKPLLEIVALDVSDELQVTDPVIFCVVLSEYVPVAVNCCAAPAAMPGLAGVTAIETRVAVCEVIVNDTVLEIVPDIAVIVVEPSATAVAKPVVVIFALLVSDEDHVTELVMFCVELSE